MLRKFRGLEITMDNIRMEEQLLPDGFDSSSLPYGPLEYFKNYGFKVSSAFPEIYYNCNGIRDDRYIPASLYFYYITPYLVNMNLSMAYVDKNMYGRHFHSVRQPETIIHNMGGRFYTPDMQELQEKEVEDYLKKFDDFIIKPSIESGRGRDVCKSSGKDENLMSLLKNYSSDYIIQKILKQHPHLSFLNPSSLNTCRLYTYRPTGSSNYVLLGGAVRFGGPGAYRDNACTGGGFCKIFDDGLIEDKIHNYKRFGWGSLKAEKNIENLKIPNYEKVIDTALNLHKSIPYMDLIGWDIAIDQDANPVLIEINQYPDCEFIQIFNGPMFGDYTDELLEAISNNKTEIKSVAKRSFPSLSSHYDYNFEIGKLYSI